MAVNIYKPLGVVINLYAYIAVYYSTGNLTMSSRDMRWGGTYNLSSSGGTFFTGKMWTTSVMFTGLSFIEVYNESSVFDY